MPLRPPLLGSDLQTIAVVCDDGPVLRFAAALVLVLAAPLVAALAVRSTSALMAVAAVEFVAVAVLLVVAPRAGSLLGDPSG